MTEIYVVHWLARELGGEYTSAMIEYVTADRAKAEQYFTEHAVKDQVMNIDSHMCEIRRMIVPVVLDQQYKP